jgi:hypothetical protein
MSNIKSQQLRLPRSRLRLLPYVILGGLIFAFNSSLQLNYFLRGYLALIESQIVIIGIFFLMAKLARRNKTEPD